MTNVACAPSLVVNEIGVRYGGGVSGWEEVAGSVGRRGTGE